MFYAHSPDALRRTLAGARGLRTGRLCVVVGAGGQRDVGKRSAMGRAAGLADEVIFTTDNPRGEDSAEIARHLAAGLPVGRDCRIELARARALAIPAASEDDLVASWGAGTRSERLRAITEAVPRTPTSRGSRSARGRPRRPRLAL